MPVYEFACEDCRNVMEVWATLEEHSRGLEPVCERCGSRRLTRKLSAPSLGSSLPSRPARQGGCDPGGGGGCCG